MGKLTSLVYHRLTSEELANLSKLSEEELRDLYGLDGWEGKDLYSLIQSTQETLPSLENIDPRIIKQYLLDSSFGGWDGFSPTQEDALTVMIVDLQRYDKRESKEILRDAGSTPPLSLEASAIERILKLIAGKINLLAGSSQDPKFFEANKERIKELISIREEIQKQLSDFERRMS